MRFLAVQLFPRVLGASYMGGTRCSALKISLQYPYRRYGDVLVLYISISISIGIDIYPESFNHAAQMEACGAQYTRQLKCCWSHSTCTEADFMERREHSRTPQYKTRAQGQAQKKKVDEREATCNDS
jgi:hypothetical protein